ncbi:signal peptide protein [Oenococcus kitaharae]|nr:signal peptide protein [Oenococcus kitaharae]OEY84130.1 signal peptide protein [Oenococcus kitaharae]OEY85754.1 signal peptide protein [Oenococcus kitaharae]
MLAFYGPLLSDKQQDGLQAFLIDDLSVSEIAENDEISRQAVFDQLKRALDSLQEFESKLHLRENYLARRKIETQLQEKFDPRLLTTLIDLEEK